MRNKSTLLAGGLLGLVFVVLGSNFFLKFLSNPPMEQGSPPAVFMGVLYTSGYLALVKVFEVLGGLLVAIPKTRNLGLLILGPIVVNILAYQIFLVGGKGLLQVPVILVTLLSAFLLWSERRSFAKLLN